MLSERSNELPIFDKGESTVITVRRHWFVLLRSIVLLLLMYVLPFIVYAFLMYAPLLSEGTPFAGASPNITLKPAMFFFLTVLWTLITWIRLFTIWTDYYLDTWIVTTKRIIDIDQEGYFRRSVGSFPVARIQDVTFLQHGIIASLLDYGTIHVETAGSNTDEFQIEEIPNPRHLRDIINKELDKALERQERQPDPA